MNFKFKKGFTLIEVLAIMAIAAIILAAATPMITKKHRVKPEQVTHGRFECWWDGNQLKQRMVSGNKVVEEKNVTGSCKFNPPANVDKFLVQAVGGGGAGGGAGSSFINSKYEIDENKSNAIFQPVIVNGSGGGTPGVSPWPVQPGTIEPKGYVAPDGLKKYGFSTKLTAQNWFKWDHLDQRKNLKAFKFIGVACSGGGGSAGSSTITDGLPYYCLENKKRATVVDKFVSCTGSCSNGPLSGYSCSNPNVNSQGCHCGSHTYPCSYSCNPYDCNCTTTTTIKSGKTTTSVSCSTCYKTCWTTCTRDCGRRYTIWNNTCTGNTPYYGCPTPCTLGTRTLPNRQTQPPDKCGPSVPSNPPEGTLYFYAPLRNSGQKGTNTCGGGSGGSGKCTDAESYIVQGITARFSPNKSGKGSRGKNSPTCNIKDTNPDRCPAKGAQDGEGAGVTITSGAPNASCSAKAGTAGWAPKIPGIPNIDEIIKNNVNQIAEAANGLGLDIDLDTINYEERGNGIYVNATGIPLIDNAFNFLIRGWAENVTQPYKNAEVRAVYMCACPGPKNGTNGTANCSCSSSLCSSGNTGPHNYRYGWSRKYHNQWLAYGEAGKPGYFEHTYVSRISGALVLEPGRGGATGDWASNSTNARGANGKDGGATIVKMGNKTILGASGGKGGQGAIVTDEYTLCSNYMYRTEQSRCAPLNNGVPQRTMHNEASWRNTTGLANFHAAFNLKLGTKDSTIAGVSNFGIGGEGQGSKSLCDSAEDTRLVWNIEDTSRYVYSNKENNSGTNTQSNDYAARCALKNVYYRPNLIDGELGTAYNVNAKYAPEIGGHGAVIITW